MVRIIFGLIVSVAVFTLGAWMLARDVPGMKGRAWDSKAVVWGVDGIVIFFGVWGVWNWSLDLLRRLT